MRNFIAITLMSGITLCGAALVGGCDDTVEHKTTTEVKDDGTKVEKESKTTVSDDGTVKKTEEKKVDAPNP